MVLIIHYRLYISPPTDKLELSGQLTTHAVVVIVGVACVH